MYIPGGCWGFRRNTGSLDLGRSKDGPGKLGGTAGLTGITVSEPPDPIFNIPEEK